VRNVPRDGCALLGIPDRGIEQALEREVPAAPARKRRLHCGHRARHRRSQHAAQRHLHVPPFDEGLARGAGRRGPARVQPPDAVFTPTVDQHKRVAAETAHHWLHDPEHRRGSDGGVDGVAAAGQHFESCSRGQGMTGSNHAAAGKNG